MTGSTWKKAASAHFEDEQVKGPRDKVTPLSNIFQWAFGWQIWDSLLDPSARDVYRGLQAGWDLGVLFANWLWGCSDLALRVSCHAWKAQSFPETMPRVGCTHPLRSAMRNCPPLRTSKILTDRSDEQVARRVP